MSVDPVARGFGTSAFITANVRQADWRSIRERLRRLPGIAHIALVGGEFDVVMLVRARDNADLRRLVLEDILNIDGVFSTRTLLVFDEPSVIGESRRHWLSCRSARRSVARARKRSTLASLMSS